MQEKEVKGRHVSFMARDTNFMSDGTFNTKILNGSLNDDKAGILRGAMTTVDNQCISICHLFCVHISHCGLSRHVLCATLMEPSINNASFPQAELWLP